VPHRGGGRRAHVQASKILWSIPPTVHSTPPPIFAVFHRSFADYLPIEPRPNQSASQVGSWKLKRLFSYRERCCPLFTAHGFPAAKTRVKNGTFPVNPSQVPQHEWLEGGGFTVLQPFPCDQSPRIFLFLASSPPEPAKSSKALSVTRMMWLRTNLAPSAAPSCGCLMQHSHSTTAQPGKSY
jgi:hypothetical protein